jgi:hypothetical protein
MSKEESKKFHENVMAKVREKKIKDLHRGSVHSRIERSIKHILYENAQKRRAAAVLQNRLQRTKAIRNKVGEMRGFTTDSQAGTHAKLTQAASAVVAAQQADNDRNDGKKKSTEIHWKVRAGNLVECWKSQMHVESDHGKNTS